MSSGYTERIVGYVSGSSLINNNFALSTMNVLGNTGDGRAGIGKSDAQLKTQSTYSGAASGDGAGGLGWLFDGANPSWKMPVGGGYPILYWQ